ncbi:deoxyguanosinetriphosphate triphosphohydrolase [Candidatus Peregrinibacteria bacterium]|nr:deoxyguanosinetriphosphate triphosphohydrolase [Candidatus Peregrinibacteria bacterium]
MILKRQQLEKNEEKILAPYACKSAKSLGRNYKEKEDENRIAFQRDRDRIIHSKSFRRLQEKTQVFVAYEGDHYRNRLTHTMEVSQISRDVARELGLNEDLAEAIALAHDLGHTPFGHFGEQALNKIMVKFGAPFEHNNQSRRIVELIEKLYPDFPGLNLTKEVIDGLIKHQTAYDQPKTKFETFPHLEAQIVNLADSIAYINHDIDDGLRGKIFEFSDLNKFPLWKKAAAAAKKSHKKELEGGVLRSRVISKLISLMIDDLVKQTEKNIKKYKIRKVEDVKKCKAAVASFSKSFEEEIVKIRDFLMKKFYMSPRIKERMEMGMQTIEKLFEAYFGDTKLLPPKLQHWIETGERRAIVIKDYIAGMTDSYAEREHRKIYGNKGTGVPL